MARRKPRIPVHLDTGDIKELPPEEINIIIRGADELIFSGGRSLLAKVLKGSKDKAVLEHGLDQSPVYGALGANTLAVIGHKVDWMIRNEYLRIEYSGRLPLLVYTPKGWEIEKDLYSDELLDGFDRMLESGQKTYDMTYLKDRNREMILLLLDKVESTGNPKYLPLLEAWKQADYKKVRKRIHKVMQTLQK